MTPDQIHEIETLVTAIRDVDLRIGPALDDQKAANDAVDALTVESEATRSAYETYMWQLRDDPDLINPAIAADVSPDAPPVDAAPEAPVEPPAHTEGADVAPETPPPSVFAALASSAPPEPPPAA